MNNSRDDVIAAIATPIGEGGIAVLRVSGAGSIAAVASRFRGTIPLEKAASHTAHVGWIVDGRGEAVDQVVATVFRAPHSYTGEDVAEISCHGGLFVSRRILAELLAAGARMAEPGEFTQRAFLNGKMDLSQAEAVADLIHARTEVSRRAALLQLEGKLSGRVGALRQKLLDLCALVELELDFTEEGIELTPQKNLLHSIEDLENDLRTLAASYVYGKITREGVRVAIIGKPNVGKSSIINNLLNENRSIVTDVPGTTRDVIEESLNIDGILFTVIDTAGLRESVDHVEREGMHRTTKTIEEADLLLIVRDASREVDEDDLRIEEEVRTRNSRAKRILVWNKIDLGERGVLPRDSIGGSGDPDVRCSAKRGAGMEELRKAMVASVHGAEVHLLERSVGVTTERHKNALDRAVAKLRHAWEEVDSGRSNEFIAVDLRGAADDLGEIVGAVTSEDLLNNIFSKFCIGK